MARGISWRIALMALTAIVTFVAMADTSEAFGRRSRRSANYGSNGGGCSSCGCATTSAPACGCTTATGTSDQAYNNGNNQQAPYAQQQQGFIQQGRPIQQGAPYEARRETYRGGDYQSGNLPSVRERSQMQSERSEMQSERSDSGSQQNQQNRSNNRSNDRSTPPPPPET
jgi:hypothetical protein